MITRETYEAVEGDIKRLSRSLKTTIGSVIGSRGAGAEPQLIHAFAIRPSGIVVAFDF